MAYVDAVRWGHPNADEMKQPRKRRSRLLYPDMIERHFGSRGLW